jgi:hypothetical protein
MPDEGAVQEYLQEACFYLAELEKPINEIASALNLTQDQVKQAIQQYREKISEGKISYDFDAKEFWGKQSRETGGDEWVTLVDEKGRYFHGWRSEIERMDTEQLVELLVVNKRYSDAHPLSQFSKTQPAVGYDPIIPLRNIRKAVSIIEEILQKRELSEGASGNS